jgi:hypothetical protein
VAFLPLSTRDKASLAACPANQSIAQHNTAAEQQAALKQAISDEEKLREVEAQAEALRRTLAAAAHERRLEVALRAMAEEYLREHPEL